VYKLLYIYHIIFALIKTVLKCNFRTRAARNECEEFVRTFDRETSRVESAWETFVWIVRQ
jgi:hypothetical protein